MADCDDRQLSEAQRQAGYQNQRTGVARAVRPFSGRPTLDNLIDYINRELFPAVKSTRDRLNDVYLPAVENAPSANPLIYYFSADTTDADPTTGRLRLDASPQNTATTIRVSEQNARLVDARPWLEVMAGGATTPLGVVTLSDAINPGRFIRFDVNSMTDQGTYWDLGVATIESSHDDPFVDGGGLVVSFIPGVASTGTTVPAGSLTPITAQSVLGNPTSSTAAPVAIALNDLSVLGRAGVLGTNVAGIDVPSTATFTGESVFLRVASTRLGIQWRPWTLVDMPAMLNNKFVGNVSGATARPAYTDIVQLAQDLFGIGFDATTHNFKLSDIVTDHFLANITGATTTPIPTPLSDVDSTSIVYDSTSHTFQRAALTGDVTSAQNSNSVTVNANAVTDAILRDSGPLSVIGRAANTTGDPADISATAGSGAVLRESGSTIGWGTIATAGLADGAVTNAKLANMAAGTFKGRSATAGTGAPQDLTGNEAAGGLRYNSTTLIDTTSTGTIASYNPTGFSALVTGVRISPAGNMILLGMALNTGQAVVLRVGRGSTTTTVTLNHEDAGATAGERFNTPNNVPVILRAGEAALVRNTEGRNNVVALAQSPRVPDADYGDITVSSVGSVWTIDNNVVSDAKLRDSAALSVIGRSANSSGDPADIAAANDGEVLRRSGTSLGFGTIATAGLADDSVTNAKLAEMAANTVKANATASTANPTDFSVGTNTVLGRVAGDIVAAQLVNAQIADATIANAKLASVTEGTLKGRAIAAGTGAPQDLTGQQAGGLLRFVPIIDTTSTGTITTYAPTGLDAATTNIRISPASDVVLRGMALANGQQVSIRVGRGSSSTVTINHEDASAAAAGERFNCPANANLVLRAGEGCVIRNGESRNNVIATGKSSVADADYGDITVSSSGTAWTIDNNAVTNAKIRDSGACSVIGRSANSTGDPADISASANDRLLARTSDSLAFQQLTDGMVAANTLSLSKLANVADNRFLGNISGSTGAVTANDFGSLNSNTIIYENTGKTFIRQALTGDVTALQNSNATTITNGAVTNAKLRNSDSLSVIGNPTNASTAPSDIAAGTDGHVLRRSGTTLGFGTVATAGIADAAVTLAKQADLAQSRVIGRAEGAGTGVPTALTPTQVVSIIDGENATWTGAHSFTGASHTVNVSGVVSATSGSTTAITAGADLVLAASTTIDLNSPTQLQSSVDLTAVTTSSATAADNLTLSTVSVVRFTGPVDPLTGMVPISNGQFVLLVNAHASVNMAIHIESTNSSAANRFAGVGTSRVIRPGEMAAAWYDGTSSRWRLLCREDADL